MITKGIIKRTPSSNLDFPSYKFDVRLPVFETAGSNEEYIESCCLCYSDKSNFDYNVGDIVYVGFEDNNLDKPVILGKLYKDNEDFEIESEEIELLKKQFIDLNNKVETNSNIDTLFSNIVGDPYDNTNLKNALTSHIHVQPDWDIKYIKNNVANNGYYFYLYNTSTKSFENKRTALLNGDYDDYITINSIFMNFANKNFTNFNGYLIFKYYIGSQTAPRPFDQKKYYMIYTNTIGNLYPKGTYKADGLLHWGDSIEIDLPSNFFSSSVNTLPKRLLKNTFNWDKEQKSQFDYFKSIPSSLLTAPTGIKQTKIYLADNIHDLPLTIADFDTKFGTDLAHNGSNTTSSLYGVVVGLKVVPASAALTNQVYTYFVFGITWKPSTTLGTEITYSNGVQLNNSVLYGYVTSFIPKLFYIKNSTTKSITKPTTEAERIIDNFNVNDIFGEMQVLNTSSYSENEQLIGYWIDGKKLYRKTIKKTNFNLQNNVEVEIGDIGEAIGDVIDIKQTSTYQPAAGSADPRNNSAYDMYYGTGGNHSIIGCRVDLTNGKIYVQSCNDAWVGTTLIVIVEYTKAN